jgi:hypothetical protein
MPIGTPLTARAGLKARCCAARRCRRPPGWSTADNRDSVEPAAAGQDRCCRRVSI